MDNNIIESAANKIDKQKKKSKPIKMLKEVPEATIPEKTKRSFWKNLFKFKAKQADHSEAQAHRLNTIYEESQSADDKNTEMELEQIKNTLRDIANSSNPSVLLNGLIGHNLEVPKDDLLHEDLAGYLTDDSSEQDEDDLEEEEKTAAHLNNLPEPKTENIKTSVEPDVVEPVKEESKKISEEKLNVKDAYSFEYSEKSGNSSEEVVEEKADKVKFDDKVEAKDVDNNIVVTPLNETESKTQELQDELLIDLSSNETAEEKLADSPKSSILKANSSSEQKDNPTDAPTDEAAAKPGFDELRSNATSENWSRCEEDLSNSTPSSFHKLEATDSSEICEEYVIWSKKLNDFSDICHNVPVPIFDTNNETKIEEPRFENHFTMVSGNTVNYSIACDPFFKDLTANQLDENSKKYGEDKQKVIRKRKMMSLLHDKQIFKDYMKEIEDNVTQNNKEDNKYDVPLNSPLPNDFLVPKKLRKLFSEIPHQLIKNSSSNNSVESIKEKTLATLERTKNKLANMLQRDSVLDPKIQSLYPDNYLEKFNIKNKIPDENVSNNTTECSTINSNQLSNVSHEKINTSESLLLQVHSLSTKMIDSEDVKEKIQANQEMQILIDELMANVLELQDACIEIGAKISDHSPDPLVSFTPIGDSEAVVSPIIEEILNKLFQDNLLQKPEYCGQNIGRVKLDYTDVNTNNIPCISNIGTSNSLNFKLTPMVRNVAPPTINSTLKTNVEHATGLLTAIYDEMCQFNPIPHPISRENSCFETFDIDDSVDSLGIMRSYDNVPSDLTSNHLSQTRHSLDELREELCVPNDFELPATSNMSNPNSSHFSTDRFSSRQPDQLLCKPKIEHLNNDEKNSRLNFGISSKADNETIQNTNNNLELPQIINLSNESKDSQLGLRKRLSRTEEKWNGQKILSEASKIPPPFGNDDDDQEDDKRVIKSKESRLPANKLLKKISKIPLNSITEEKKILKTGDVDCKIILNLNEGADDKNQGTKDKQIGKQEETISLTNMILAEACTIPLPLSDDEEEKEDNKLLINKIGKREEIVSLTNLVIDEAFKISLALSDDEKENNNKNVENKASKKDEKISISSSIPIHILKSDSSTKYKTEFSRTTTFESQPGPSKPGRSLAKARKSSTILLPRLPSVPSTEINCVSLEDNNTLQTIIRNDLSACSSASNDYPMDPEEINFHNFNYFSDHSFEGTSTPLERKTSTTNLPAAMHNFNLMHDFLTESELDFYIKTNIRDFEESIQKTIDYNKTTLDMMNSSKIGTPEGSLTILSTISENLVMEAANQSNTQLPKTGAEEENNLNLDLNLNNAIAAVEETVITKSDDEKLDKQKI